MERISVREIKKEELFILESMLYEAIYQDEGSTPLPYDIIKSPEIDAYIHDFGKLKDDYCLVAVLNDKIIGAVWIRILAGEVKGFGNIDNETPEFAISLLKEYRNQGYGTLLMSRMIEHLRKEGYKQTSLSVDKNNYAVRMYQKLGFGIIQDREHDYLMVLDIKKKHQIISPAKYNKQLGILMIVFNSGWLYLAVSRLYSQHFGGILYFFMYPDWFLVLESICSIIGILLGVAIIYKRLKFRHGLLINATIFSICMFIGIYITL